MVAVLAVANKRLLMAEVVESGLYEISCNILLVCLLRERFKLYRFADTIYCILS